MPPLLPRVVYLCPPKGPALVLKDEETWIGRATFELSAKGPSICSRKQARLKHANSTVQLECHGLNPIYLVVCRSLSFQATDAALSSLRMLRKGEVVELTDGDRFYLAPKECLITVGIKPVKSGRDETAVQHAIESGNSIVHNDLDRPSQAAVPECSPDKGVEEIRLCEPTRPIQTGVSAESPVDGQNPSTDNRPEKDDYACANVIKTSCIPRGFSCAPDIAEPVESRVTVSGCYHSTDAVVLASGSVVHGEGCEPNVHIGEMNRMHDVEPGTRTCPVDLRGASNRMEIDLEEDAATLTRGTTGDVFSGLPAEQNRIEERKLCASIARIESDGRPSQNPLPCDSSASPQVAAPLRRPCSDSDVAGAGPQVTSVLQEMPETLGSGQVASPSPDPGTPRKSSDYGFRGSPINLDEYRTPDSVKVHLDQQEIVDLSVPDEDEEMGFQTTDMGFCLLKNQREGAVNGMENVIATVSGYDNLHRARLISLINLTGAAYTGSLTRSNTHVVCWKFKGPKYGMAVKCKKFIVNHLWFEDCLKAGKRVPEDSYTSSGDSVAPLIWSPPSVQHPSSDESCEGERPRDFPLPTGLSQTLLQPIVAAGESSKSVRGRSSQRFVHEASSSRCGLIDLDRGKAHSQELAIEIGGRDGPGLCQSGRLARAIDSPENGSSPRHGGPEQESDEFWNEVITTCEKGKQVADNDDRVLPETRRNPTLNFHGDGRVGHANPSFAGSSSRQANAVNVNDKIIHNKESPIVHGAQDLGRVENRVLHGTIQSNSPGREQPSNRHSDDGIARSHSKVFLRKRKYSSGEMSGQGSGNYQRLVREHEVLGRPDQSSLPLEGLVVEERARNRNRHSTHRVVDMGESMCDDEATLSTDPTLQETSASPEDECRPVDDVSDTPKGTPSKSERSKNEITCVICHSEAKLVVEGVLTCGHKFCYPCIQRWADEARTNLPTCPLCKVPFEFITYRKMDKAGVEGSGGPVLEERIVIVGQTITRPEPRCPNLPSLITENLCITCGSRDTSELLLICTNCRERACHTFCLDPPRPPSSSWFCSRCLPAQSRVQTREAYGRLFRASSPRSLARSAFTRFGASVASEQTLRTPPRRRQHSLSSYLLRNPDD